MAQPLPPEPPRVPEAPDRAVSAPDRAERPMRLLQEPPERKRTGPRPRLAARSRRPAADDTPLPARGAGMTIISYLISGILAYGAIGWLIGRPTHLPILAPLGMLAGLGISLGLVIYRYGRSTPPRIRRFAPEAATEPATGTTAGAAAPGETNEQNGRQTTTMREELTGDR